jgi:hypothetical protein
LQDREQPRNETSQQVADFRGRFVTLGVDSAVLQPFNPTATNRLEGRPVFRSPGQLRLHPALKELGWTGVIDELNDAARLNNQFVTGTVFATSNDTVIAGFGRWHAALLDGSERLECIQYPLSEDEALQFILANHQPQPVWNDFIRICLALKLEPHFRQKAMENLRAGGRYKGLATVPEAYHIDVRHQVARVAGVGDRNVDKVRDILSAAHPKLIQALRDGTLSINRAFKWCSLPKGQQLERFIDDCMERATDETIHRYVKESTTEIEASMALNRLQLQEEQVPGSVLIRFGRNTQTIVLVGRDIAANLIHK